MIDHAGMIFDTSAKMTVLGLLVWLGTQRTGVAEARRAHAAWLTVLSAFVALPILALALAPVTTLVAAPALRERLPELPSMTMLWLLAAYVAITSLMLSRLASAWLRVRSVRRDARPVVAANEPEAALLRWCQAHGAVVVETTAVQVPATAGVWRPAVLLPEGWRTVDPVVLSAMLRHELAHIRRRAYATAIAARIVTALFWFHPIAWLASARLRWFEELACDREAAGDDLLQYARVLLSAARQQTSPPRELLLSAGSCLGRRIELLIDAPAASRAMRVPLFCAAVLLAALPFVSARIWPAPVAVLSSGHEASHAARHGFHPHQ